MSTLTLTGICKRFGDTNAVSDVELDVASGESMVLLGPSGCGKTTILRMIAGFEVPTSGEIRIGDRLVSGQHAFVPPEDRELGMVFQSYALWPHLTAAANVAFGLGTRAGRRRKRRTRAEVDAAVESALEQVQLGGLGTRYPHELSGGQQQRVALARALVVDPAVLLLDEPLSNLDTRLREEMRLEIRRIQQESGITMIYITHDRSEALGLADRIVSLKLGRIQQVGSPEQLYSMPRSRFVAGALGPSNVLPAIVTTAGGELPTGQVVALVSDDDATPPVGARLDVAIRPHEIVLTAADPDTTTDGDVIRADFLGDERHYLIRLHRHDEPIRVHTRDGQRLEPGSSVRVHVASSEATVLVDEHSTQQDETREAPALNTLNHAARSIR